MTSTPKREPWHRVEPRVIFPTLIARAVRAAWGLPELPLAVIYVRAKK